VKRAHCIFCGQKILETNRFQFWGSDLLFLKGMHYAHHALNGGRVVPCHPYAKGKGNPNKVGKRVARVVFEIKDKHKLRDAL